MSRHIDLNCDMGESFGAWNMGADAAVMPWVTSANIACGGHAGDPVTMRATVSAAARAGVAIGAHVGLPDKEGFGRRAMAITPAQLEAMTITQLGALMAMAQACGAQVGHLKPHGALYHMVEKDPELASAMVTACQSVDPAIRMVGLAGGELVARASHQGLAVAHEAFIDRRYLADGALTPRSRDDAVIEDPDQALAQALQLVREGRAATAGGGSVEVRGDTLCIHGDRADAEAFAQHMHAGLTAAGLELRALAATS